MKTIDKYDIVLRAWARLDGMAFVEFIPIRQMIDAKTFDPEHDYEHAQQLRSACRKATIAVDLMALREALALEMTTEEWMAYEHTTHVREEERDEHCAECGFVLGHGYVDCKTCRPCACSDPVNVKNNLRCALHTEAP